MPRVYTNDKCFSLVKATKVNKLSILSTLTVRLIFAIFALAAAVTISDFSHKKGNAMGIPPLTPPPPHLFENYEELRIKSCFTEFSDPSSSPPPPPPPPILPLIPTLSHKLLSTDKSRSQLVDSSACCAG